MTVITATVRDGQIVPDSPLTVPDGTHLKIEATERPAGRRMYFGMLAKAPAAPIDTELALRQLRSEWNAHFEEEMDEFFPRN